MPNTRKLYTLFFVLFVCSCSPSFGAEDYLCSVDPIVDPDICLIADLLMQEDHCPLGFKPDLVASMPGGVSPGFVSASKSKKSLGRCVTHGIAKGVKGYIRYRASRPPRPLFIQNVYAPTWSQHQPVFSSNRVHGYQVNGNSVIQLY